MRIFLALEILLLIGVVHAAEAPFSSACPKLDGVTPAANTRAVHFLRSRERQRQHPPAVLRWLSR